MRTALPSKSPTAQLAARLLRSSVCTALLRGKQVPAEFLAAELASAAESSFVPKNALLGTCGCGQCEPTAPKETPRQFAERRERATDMSLENWVDFLSLERTPNARTIEKILAIGVGPHFLRHISKPHEIEPSDLRRCDYVSTLIGALYALELTNKSAPKTLAKEKRDLADALLRKIATRWIPSAKGSPTRTVAVPALSIPGMPQRYDRGWTEKSRREQHARLISFRAATEAHRFRVEHDHVSRFDMFKPADPEWLLYYLLSVAWAPGFQRAFHIVGTRWALDLASVTIAVYARRVADACIGDLAGRARRHGPARLLRGIAGIWSMLAARNSLDIDVVGVAIVFADLMFIQPDTIGAQNVAKVQWHLLEARKLLPGLMQHIGMDAELVRQAWSAGHDALPIPAEYRSRAPTTAQRLFARVGITVSRSTEPLPLAVEECDRRDQEVRAQLDLLVNELASVLRRLLESSGTHSAEAPDVVAEAERLTTRIAALHAANRATASSDEGR